MKLWRLTWIEKTLAYDVAYGFVIRAKDEHAARLIANGFCGDEGEIWTDPARARCMELTVDGPPALILRDFNAG